MISVNKLFHLQIVDKQHVLKRLSENQFSGRLLHINWDTSEEYEISFQGLLCQRNLRQVPVEHEHKVEKFCFSTTHPRSIASETCDMHGNKYEKKSQNIDIMELLNCSGYIVYMEEDKLLTFDLYLNQQSAENRTGTMNSLIILKYQDNKLKNGKNP